MPKIDIEDIERLLEDDIDVEELELPRDKKQGFLRPKKGANKGNYSNDD